MKYPATIVSLCAMVLLLSACQSREVRTSNPDGTPFNESQIVDLEKGVAERNSRIALKKDARMSDRYSSVYQKSFITGFNQLKADGAIPEATGEARPYAGMGALDMLNVGLVVFDAGWQLAPLWMSLIPGDGQLQGLYKKTSYDALYKPYLELYVVDYDTAMDADVTEKDAIMESQFQGIRSWAEDHSGLDCGAVIHDAGDVDEAGIYLEGIRHYRFYYCTEGDSLAGWKREGRLINLHIDTHAPQNYLGPLSSKTDKTAPVYSRLIAFLDVFPEWNTEDGAIRYYNAIRATLPENWYAVFSGPDRKGEWKVFVAQGNRVAAFNPPVPRDQYLAKRK